MVWLLENSGGGGPQRIKRTQQFHSGYTPQRTESRDSQRYLYPMFTAARSQQAKGGIHTVEYDSALKRKEILTPAMTWMNPEDVTASAISQSQDTVRLHFYE